MSAADDTLPADVRAVLSQLFAEAEQAVSVGDSDTARSLIDSADTVTTNKVPAGEVRELLLDGCTRVEDVLDGDGNDDARRALAAEYCGRLRVTVEEGV
jgi:hypothetical protein